MREGKRERERERERDGEKEGCALTVGIHERSPPGGLACERTLCSSLSTLCLPPSFSFSPLTYRLIFFTGPEVGGSSPLPYIRLSAAYPPTPVTYPSRRKAWNTGKERNMGEFRKIPRALINRL